MLMEKPLPLPTEDSEKYWEACDRGELTVARCRSCGHRFLPPAPLCAACWSEEIEQAKVSGRARVHSWIVVHRPQHPAFFDEAPYNVAIVELDEGPRMHTRLVGVDPNAICVGMEVEVVFERVDDEVNLPLFKPVRSRSDRRVSDGRDGGRAPERSGGDSHTVEEK